MSRRAASHAVGRGELIDIDIAELRNEFRLLRRQRRISQADVARLLRVSQATISSFEQGRHAQTRSKTLLQIHRIVVFWNDESISDSTGSNSTRGVACSDASESECLCGHTSHDSEAAYCSRCGKLLGRSSAAVEVVSVERIRKALRESFGRWIEHDPMIVDLFAQAVKYSVDEE